MIEQPNAAVCLSDVVHLVLHEVWTYKKQNFLSKNGKKHMVKSTLSKSNLQNNGFIQTVEM